MADLFERVTGARLACADRSTRGLVIARGADRVRFLNGMISNDVAALEAGSSCYATLLDRKGVGRYAVYLMDYGAPVGYRMFAEDPRRVSGFIIQNGNAYEEGLQDFWNPIRAYWADPSAAISRAMLAKE